MPEMGHHRQRAAEQAGLTIDSGRDWQAEQIAWLVKLAGIQTELIHVLLPNVGEQDADRVRDLNRRLLEHYTVMPSDTL